MSRVLDRSAITGTRFEERSKDRSQERSQERSSERFQERSRERSQERYPERSQERSRGRSQERSQERSRGRSQERSQERSINRSWENNLKKENKLTRRMRNANDTCSEMAGRRVCQSGSAKPTQTPLVILFLQSPVQSEKVARCQRTTYGAFSFFVASRSGRVPLNSGMWLRTTCTI